MLHELSVKIWGLIFIVYAPSVFFGRAEWVLGSCVLIVSVSLLLVNSGLKKIWIKIKGYPHFYLVTNGLAILVGFILIYLPSFHAFAVIMWLIIALIYSGVISSYAKKVL